MTRPARSALRWPLALLVVGTPAFVRTWRLDDYTWQLWPRAAGVAAAALVATIVVGVVSRSPRRWAVPLVAVVGGAAVEVAGGFTVAGWLTVQLALVAWVFFDAPTPAPRLAAPDPSVAGVVIAAAGISTAVVAAAVDNSTLVATGLLAAASLVVVGASVAPRSYSIVARRARSLPRLVRSFARLIAGVVSSILLTLLWIPTVLVPWIAHRVTRLDITASPTASGSTWVERNGAVETPARMWASDPNRRRRTPLGTLHRAATTMLGLLLIAAAIAVPIAAARDGHAPRPVIPTLDLGGDATLTPSASNSPTTTSPTDVVIERMQRQPWFYDLGHVFTDMFTRTHFTQWVGQVLPDTTSNYLNIKDGSRHSWAPAVTGCGTPLRVWMFGGSTLFGVGQRDEQTVSSEVARAAAATGIRMDMRNYGVPGDVSWQENRRLSRLLFTTSERPDLVIFYDGFNDLHSFVEARGTARGAPGDFLGPLDRLHMKVLDNLQVLSDDQTYQGRVPKVAPDPRVPVSVAVDATEIQYGAADREAHALVEAFKIRMVHFHQPNLALRAEIVPGEPVSDPDSTTAARLMRDHLPKGIVDVSSALDSVREPRYNDAVHVEEAGNVPIAAAIFRSLQQSQSALLASHKGQPCS